MLPIQKEIWASKYKAPEDNTIEDSWLRVAKALAVPEKDTGYWTSEFYRLLKDFKFLPGGRILAGAGTGRSVTLFNCFVMGTIPDSMDGIFASLREAALTMQQGGGIGMDFSSLRPKGAAVLGVGADASGPLPFMDTWNAMCGTIMSAGSRRGAMMGCLRCDHPDIEAFVEAKRDKARFRNFNLSVLVTNDFMNAVAAGASWALRFDGVPVRAVEAKDLWQKIVRASYDCAEPGVIFIDRVNEFNNLAYCETLSATNPCGEQPLPPYGNCLLGSLNLTRFVASPFASQAGFDYAAIIHATETAIRMLDNVLDVSRYPLPQQEEEAKSKRRVGIGITGLGSALAMCGLEYGSQGGRDSAGQVMSVIAQTAYRASAELAREKGPFPALSKAAYLQGQFVKRLPCDLTKLIRKHGIRNSHLVSIAPTGTISLLAGNVSSGIEPIFDYEYERRVLQPDGSHKTETVRDYAVELYGASGKGYPSHFQRAADLTPEQHLGMQAALQPYVDSAISKTINCPPDISFENFEGTYRLAHDLGLKGCTVYRPNSTTGAVLTSKSTPPAPAPAPAPANLAARPVDVPGRTYKLAWPGSEHAIYITINDLDGKPYEVFINSKSMEHYAWTVALTRMISAIFRRGGDIAFVAEELKAVFDPRGGAWMGRKYVPSVIAAIGDVIGKHLGLSLVDKAAAPYCPRCESHNVTPKGGCVTCRDCGYSSCS